MSLVNQARYVYSCSYCRARKTTENSIRNHVINSHPKRPCVYNVKEIRKCQNSEMLLCPWCGYRHALKDSVYKHIVNKHPGCQKLILNETSGKICKKKAPVKKINEKASPKKLVSLSVVRDGEGYWICPKCPYKDILAEKVLDHMASEHGGAGFKCGRCGFEATDTVSITDHSRKEHPNAICVLRRIKADRAPKSGLKNKSRACIKNNIGSGENVAKQEKETVSDREESLQRSVIKTSARNEFNLVDSNARIEPFAKKLEEKVLETEAIVKQQSLPRNTRKRKVDSCVKRGDTESQSGRKKKKRRKKSPLGKGLPKGYPFAASVIAKTDDITGEPVFHCGFIPCLVEEKSVTTLGQHIVSKHKDKLKQCPYCDYLHCSRVGIRKHLKKAHRRMSRKKTTNRKLKNVGTDSNPASKNAKIKKKDKKLKSDLSKAGSSTEVVADQRTETAKMPEVIEELSFWVKNRLTSIFEDNVSPAKGITQTKDTDCAAVAGDIDTHSRTLHRDLGHAGEGVTKPSSHRSYTSGDALTLPDTTGGSIRSICSNNVGTSHTNLADDKIVREHAASDSPHIPEVPRNFKDTIHLPLTSQNDSCVWARTTDNDSSITPPEVHRNPSTIVRGEVVPEVVHQPTSSEQQVSKNTDDTQIMEGSGVKSRDSSLKNSDTSMDAADITSVTERQPMVGLDPGHSGSGGDAFRQEHRTCNVRSHNNENASDGIITVKRYKCNWCEYACLLPSQMRKHNRNMHPEKQLLLRKQ